MAENITQCPKCQVSFRITDNHLALANGSVRCGSCLTIFNAKEHLINEDDSDDLLISDDMDLSDPSLLEDLDEELSEEFTRATSSNLVPSSTSDNLFERDVNKGDDDEDEPLDEAWALDLLKADDELDELVGTTPQEDNANTSEATLNDQTLHHEDRVRYDDYHYDDIDSTSYADQFDSENLEIIDDEFEEANKHLKIENYHKTDQEDDQPKVEVTPGLSAQFLDSIEPEPVEFFWSSPRSWLNSKIMWGSLSLLAAALLFAQFAWFNLDEYSKQDRFHPYYAKACEWLNCTLPPRIDLRKISARNVVVRNNPKAANFLKVDFVLHNAAKFKQPYPPIELKFTDHRNKAVAARCFKPDEYLAGEVSRTDLMPTRQPVRITIDIEDPGSQASGYKIGICR